MEVLAPDFCGDPEAVARVLDAGPHVFNHNMETVARLYPRVRPQAVYQQSLDVLYFARQYRRDVLTKSGFMVGLGETQRRSGAGCSHDLRAAEVDIATIGQYLQPTRRNLPVAAYIEPRQLRRVPRLRPLPRLQDGLQRAAGAQFLHGRPGGEAGAAIAA